MKRSDALKCPVCGGELSPHIVCGNCGADITMKSIEGLEENYKCPVCGSDAKVKFICSDCGSEFPYTTIMKNMDKKKVEKKKANRVEKGHIKNLERGLSTGIPSNGLTNGNGITNGNGLTNGNGITNGNGLTNGNGITNGNGLTNGLGKNGKKKERKPSKKKKSVVPVVGSIIVIIVLLVSALYVMHAPARSGMGVDGNFSDWKDVPALSEYEVPTHNMDMISYASKLSDGGLYMYLKSEGPLFSEGGSRIYAFVDADNNTNTGYKINGIGADYLCKVYGNSDKGGIVHAAYSYNHSDSGLEWSWSSFEPLELPMAYSGNQLEMAIYSSYIQKDYRIAFYTSDTYGNYEMSSVNIGEKPSLYFEARRSHIARDVYEFGMGEVHLMDINIFATGGDVGLSSIHLGASNLGNIILKDSSGKTISSISGGQLSLNTMIKDGKHVSYQIWGQLPSSGKNGTLISIDGLGISTSTGAIVHTDAKAFKAYLGKPASIKIDGAFGDWTNIKYNPLNETVPAHIDIGQYSSSDDSNNLYFYVGVEKGMMAGVMVPEKYSEGRPTNNVSTQHIAPPATGEDILIAHISTEDNKEYTIQILGKGGDIVSYKVSGPDMSGGTVKVFKDSTRLEGSVSLQTFKGSQIKSIWFEMSDWSKKRVYTDEIEPEHISVDQGTRSVSGPFISHIRESDQTSKYIVISWVTDVNSTGEVRYSTHPDLSNYSVAQDRRGENHTLYNTTLHVVEISDLSPETVYYYEAISSTPQKTTTDNNGGKYYNFTTPKLLSSTSPQKALLGRIYKSDGSTYAEGAIVYVNVTTQSGDESYPLSSVANKNGTWTVDSSNFINKQTGDQIAIQKGDSIYIEVEGGLMGTGTKNTTVDDNDPQDCGSIVLGNLPVSAVTSFLTGAGNEVHSYIIGDNIYVKVMDNDSSANNPSKIDTVNATVEDPITGDKEDVELVETGNDTGIFVNFSHPIISINESTGRVDDRILSTAPGHYIYLSYIDTLDGDNDTTNNEKISKALMVGYSDQSIHFVDENGTSMHEYHIGDKIYVILTSSNNTAPKISHIRESDQTSKYIVISWVTDVNSTGEVRYSTHPDLSNYSVAQDRRGENHTLYNTTLHVVEISDLSPETVYYYEAISSTPQKTTTDNNGGKYYNFTTPKLLSSTSPQKALLGRIYKSDGSTYAEGAIVYVNVTTQSGDESYPLSSVANKNGTWTVDSSNFINKQTGDQIAIQKGDSIYIEVEGGLMGTGTKNTTVDDNDPQDCGSIVLGSPYHVSPPVPGANQNSNVSENVTVSIKDPLTGDFESVVLNETGPNTSVFMNTWDIIGSSTNSSVDNDSMIETGDNHIIEVSYYSLNDTAIMLNQSKGLVSFVDSGGNDVDKYVVGDDIYIKIVDSNADLNSSSPDSIYVNVSDLSTGDWENVSLAETGNDTGVFTNSADILHSSKTIGAKDDGTLETENGDVINVSYADKDPAGYVGYDEAKMVAPILHINKTSNRSSASPGEEFYYTIVVSNTGLDSALSVKIVDVLPENLTYINDTANADEVSHDGQRNTWTYNVLNPGDSISFRIYVKVADNAGNGTITNNATLNYTDSHNRAQASLYSTADTTVPEFKELALPIIFTISLLLILVREKDKNKKIKEKRRR